MRTWLVWFEVLAAIGLSGCAATLDFDGQTFVEADAGETVDADDNSDTLEDTGVVDTGSRPDTEPLFDARQDSTEETVETDTGCEPRPEVCDGIDNDCDGLIDAADPTVVWDAANCGACGEDCSAAPRAAGICNADWSCGVQRCLEAGFRDLNGRFADGCEFSIGAPLHWLSQLAVAGFTQVAADRMVAWGDSGAQLYDIGAGVVPMGAFGARNARVVSAEVVDGTLLLGMESTTDGAGLLYRHPIATPFAFDSEATPVRLSRPPTDIASTAGRIVVSSAAPGAVQMFEFSGGTYRFLGSVNPFAGADVLGLAVGGDGGSGYAIGRDGSCRSLVFASSGTPIALGSGSVTGLGSAEAIGQTSMMVAGRLVVAILMRAGGGGGSLLRLVSDVGSGPVVVDFALSTQDGVAVAASGGRFRVLHQDGSLSLISADGIGPAEEIGGPAGLTGVRTFGPGASQWLVATAEDVALAALGTDGVTIAAGSPVGLSPSGLVSTEGGWLLATGVHGSWMVSEQSGGGLALNREDEGAAALVARAGDGARFAISADGELRGWLESGGRASIPTGLTGISALEAGDGWVVALSSGGAFAQAYTVSAGEVSFPAAGTLLEGRFSSLAVDSDRVALGSGLEVAWYRLTGGWDFGGRITGPASMAGVAGVRWSSDSLIAVMDSGAGLWIGDTATGTADDGGIPSAAAGVRDDSANGLFGRSGLIGWRSAARGIAIWFAGPEGSVRLGTLDATRPGTSAYLPTPCEVIAGGFSSTTVAAAETCGVTLWRHQPLP